MKANSPADLKAISDKMPSKIEKALDFPVVKEVAQVAGEAQVIKYLEFELITLASLVSVGNNLNNAQVPFVARQLLDLYPYETLADFKICFQRGAIGVYGPIFRLDGIVIGEWMQKYLEEKAETKDRVMEKEKQANKAKELQTFTGEVLRSQERDRLGMIEKMLKGELSEKEVFEQTGLKPEQEPDDNKYETRAVPKLKDAEIRREGRERPAASGSYQPMSVEEFKAREFKFFWTCHNFLRDGTKKPDWMPEDEWIKANRTELEDMFNEKYKLK